MSEMVVVEYLIQKQVVGGSCQFHQRIVDEQVRCPSVVLPRRWVHEVREVDAQEELSAVGFEGRSQVLPPVPVLILSQNIAGDGGRDSVGGLAVLPIPFHVVAVEYPDIGMGVVDVVDELEGHGAYQTVIWVHFNHDFPFSALLPNSPGFIE